VIRRGDIWWASLGEPVGSAPGFNHPVLVVQADDFNASRISTVICCVITSNLHLKDAPGNVLLKKAVSKLVKDSVVNVSQMVTIDKTFLHEKVSHLSHEQMEEVDEGMRLVLCLA